MKNLKKYKKVTLGSPAFVLKKMNEKLKKKTSTKK